MKSRILPATSALSGALAVILGALAAHALHDQLEAADHLDSWETAALYHLTHSIAAFTMAHAGYRKVAWTMLAGILLFSGSIYMLCLIDGLSWLGPITPIGGVLLIAAWVALAKSSFQGKS